MTVIDAGSNPAQAQDMINSVMNMVNSGTPDVNAQESAPVDVVDPPETVVTLPGGYLTFSGEVITEAEVRELTGRDEEALARTTSQETLVQTVLTRGTLRVGSEKASEEILNNLLSGDRDYLLLKIFVATFGETLTVSPFCKTCNDRPEVEINLNKDVPVKTLASPKDRYFRVPIARGEVKAELPTGHTQRLLMAEVERSFAELSTVLLANTVTEVRGTAVIDPAQVLDLSIRDRRKISEQILSRSPGPLMQDTTCKCPRCDSTLEVPLSLANLFRL